MDTKADISRLNLNEVCRVCAKPSDFLVHLCELLDNGNTLEAMLSKMIHIWNIENISRPMNICLDCKPQLIAAFEFYSLFLESEEIFKKYDGYESSYSSTAVDTLSFKPFEYCEIKLEDKHEYLSDSGQHLEKIDQIHHEQITSTIITVDSKKNKQVAFKKQYNADTHHNRPNMPRMSVTTNTCPNVNDRTEITFQCFDCKKCFAKRTQLIKHTPAHEIICTVCSRSLRSLNEYECHICDEANNIQCQYCTKQCDSIAELLHHLEEEDETAAKISFKCERCTKTFWMQHLLDLHAMAHNSQRYPCRICGKIFPHRRLMNNHLRFVHATNRPFLCQECGKSFKTSSCLKRHTFLHTGSKPFACPECPSAFGRKGGLKEHFLQVHGSEKHGCDNCGAVLKTSQALRIHQKSHSKVADKKCEICQMKFCNNYRLTRHMMTHTGEKPYKCSYCGRAYKQNGDLNKHLRTHVGENIYKCDSCSMTFRLPWELRRHISEHYRSHHENKSDKETSTE